MDGSDLRIALRSLFRNKGFALASSLTLALGIAATTTIFSVVYGVLLRPLPYSDSSRLVVIQGEKAYSTGPRIMNFSAPELEPFLASTRAFSSIAISKLSGFTYRSEEGVESIPAATVSAEFFTTLGTPPLLGRTLEDESAPNIVISERLWQRLFNRTPQVIGQAVRFVGWQNIERLYTIVGVMPHEFQYPERRTDVWKTLAFARAMDEERVRELVPGGHQFIVRVKNGVTIDAARSDAARVVDTVLKPHFTTSRTDMYAKVTPLGEAITSNVGPALWILMGAVTLVLLVACANVANLILVRQSSRWREISVRLALGAPRARLLTFLLTEAAIVGAAGAAIGAAIAAGGIRLLQWMEPSQLPRLDAIVIDMPILLFAAAVTVAAVGVAGFVPAWFATHADAAAAMTHGMRGPTSTIARGLRSALVVAQIAASIILLVGASLLARSLMEMMNTDLGVNTENVITAAVDMTLGRTVTPERQLQIARDLEERVGALPLVRSAGVGSGLPPNFESMRVSFIFSNGTTTESHMVTTVPASPGYFSTLQVRLLRGRFFTDDDTANAPPVVIVNREAARRFFGAEDPIGRALPIMNTQITVVGVVDNVRYTGFTTVTEGVLYRPFAQSPLRVAVLIARTAGDPRAVAADLRRIITDYDPGLNVARLQPLTTWISDAAAQPRFRTITLSTIAIITLVLAMIGLYGVMAYSTMQRTTEIGVRMAIGARRGDVVRMVIGEGARLAVIGILLGMVGAFLSSRLLAAFLYRVTPTDLGAFAASAIALFLVALFAAYFPAARAAGVDPAVALRSE